MYATGMSPAEMQKFAQVIDWNEACFPSPPTVSFPIAASRITATTRLKPRSVSSTG
jgi:hypothetical protein